MRGRGKKKSRIWNPYELMMDLLSLKISISLVGLNLKSQYNVKGFLLYLHFNCKPLLDEKQSHSQNRKQKKEKWKLSNVDWPRVCYSCILEYNVKDILRF